MNSLLALSLLLLQRKTHRTSHQCQINHQNAQKGKEVYAQALMHAMILVAGAREKENHELTWSILKQVERAFATQGHPVSLNTKTVNCYVQNDMVCAPLLRGYKGVISKAAFNLLVLTVESFIQIKQLNSKVIMWKQLLIVLNELRGIKLDIRVKENMLGQVMAATTASLNVNVVVAVKERRLMWTTYDNLFKWFMLFKAFLLKYGFATPRNDSKRHPIFNKRMLQCILNINETKILLNGSNSQAGGHPAILFHDPHLPMVMKLVAKSSYKCTGISGSNAVGEVVPPHFQLPTAVTAVEHKKVQFDFFVHIKKTHGQFGCNKVKKWPCGFGTNKKGGMNDVEFYKYMIMSSCHCTPTWRMSRASTC